MAGSYQHQEYDVGQLLGIVLAMIQERIGVFLGGTVFLNFVPALVFIPAGISAFMLGAQQHQGEFDPAKLIPLLTSLGISMLLYIPLYFGLRTGWVAICLKITRNEPAPFSEFFSNFGYFLNFLFTQILMGIAAGVGFCLLVVPGIFVGIKLCFAPLLVIDKNMGPVEALQASWTMTEGYFWKIFLACLSAMVINIIVSFIPFVGTAAQLFVMAFIDLLITALYRQQNGDLVEAS